MNDTERRVKREMRWDAVMFAVVAAVVLVFLVEYIRSVGLPPYPISILAVSAVVLYASITFWLVSEAWKGFRA